MPKVGIEVTDSYELPNGCQKLNLRPLKEQELLTTDPFFDLKIVTTHWAVMAHTFN